MERKEEKTICQSTTTFSSILGSLSAVIADYTKNLFPKGYIKSYYINTRDFSEEIEDDDVIRKEKPILTLKPKFSFDSEDVTIGRVPTWQYGSDFIFKPMKYHYFRTLYDPNNKAYIYFTHERYKVSFDIDMRFTSRLQAINAAHFFKNRERHRMWFYIEDIWLETTIPKSMIYGLARHLKFDLEKDEDIASFVNYLNMYSNYRITKKTSMSSGISNYYFRFKTRLMVQYPNYPELDDGDSNGQVTTDFTVSTSMEIEFNAPNNFFLELGQIIEIEDLKEMSELEFLSDQEVVVSLPPNDIPDIVKNEVQKLVVWQGYIAESSTIDIVNIEDALNEELNIIIDQNNSNNPKLNEEMFEVLLYRDGEKMNPKSYKMDWQNKDLINKRPEADVTYYFGIYIDTLKAKEILEKHYSNSDILDKLDKVVKE